jgi:hypothetical protein
MGTPGRSFPQTITNIHATNAADRASADIVPPCAAFSIEPAASPLAKSGRTVQAGPYPILVYILDESKVEVNPPLIVNGPLVFRLGGQCKGLRLESTTLSSGADYSYDVTIDPDPAGEWTASDAARTKFETDTVLGDGTNQIDVTRTKPPWAHSLVVACRTDLVSAVNAQVQLIQPGDGVSLIQDGQATIPNNNANALRLLLSISMGYPVTDVVLAGGAPVMSLSTGMLPFSALRIATGLMPVGKRLTFYWYWCD